MEAMKKCSIKNQSADDYMKHDKSTLDEDDAAFHAGYIARVFKSQRPIESAASHLRVDAGMSRLRCQINID